MKGDSTAKFRNKIHYSEISCFFWKFYSKMPRRNLILSFIVQGGKCMKWYKSAAVFMALCVGLFFVYSAVSNHAVAQSGKTAERITVLNPLGNPPPIQLKNMAPRLDTLEGKTIYLVDDGYIGGDNLLYEMQDWFRENFPKTEAIYKRKGGGGFEAEDPALWAEMKEKADAIIIALGH